MRALILLTIAAALSFAAFAARTARRHAAPAAAPAETTTEAPTSHAASASADSDRDGIPDRLELLRAGDRDNFRRWFAYIAERQFYEQSDAWNTEQRDCAGLVRFAWREALRRHDRLWLRRMGAAYDAVAPDVAAYTLDRAPSGERLFRTSDRSLDDTDEADKIVFSDFADARTLREYNAAFLSRDPRAARTGDLLFFRQPWGARYPYHVMIYVGASQVAADDGAADDWVVYHTGSSPTDAGTVKKVRLAALERHPDARWRPVQGNPRFLGFYRLKILD